MAHLQLKDIPDDIHSAVRTRARRSGVSMREYVLRLIEHDLGRRDTPLEMCDRLRALPKAEAAPDAASLLRTIREEQDARRVD